VKSRNRNYKIFFWERDRRSAECLVA